ncbi:MAG: tetratricopeptide repeat protein [Planctomycetota bacterium]|jgi:tetratricopeptide (TPR) repeat protein
MARWILAALLIVILNVAVGCGDIDTGKAQLVPEATKEKVGKCVLADVSDAGESDIVEQIVVNRRAYQQSLELLVDHYTKTGNNMKLTWSERELAALDAVPQYNYIVEAGVAGPDLKATTAIPDADYMYSDALTIEEGADWLLIIKDEDKLREALDKYNQLIRKHPSSDKIDDAAYRAAGIYEHFKDYTIALLYYKRAYQWNPETIYPARFKVAYILDNVLHRREEALAQYKVAIDAIKREGDHLYWHRFAERRIEEITQADKSVVTE